METRTLGTNGPRVSAIGLGCMGMSGMYGPADEAESIATIHARSTPASTCSTPAAPTKSIAASTQRADNEVRSAPGQVVRYRARPGRKSGDVSRAGWVAAKSGQRGG
jgi:hypothetical protein